MKRVIVFLITVVLIAGMTGCGPTPVQYNLAITSTEGGSVSSPGEGTFTYSPGTIVGLVAEPEDGYRFINWTGDVDTVANVNSATTTIIMGNNCSITGNFGEYAPMIAASWYQTVGLNDDGTVVAVGDNTYGQCNVSGWDLN